MSNKKFNKERLDKIDLALSKAREILPQDPNANTVPNGRRSGTVPSSTLFNIDNTTYELFQSNTSGRTVQHSPDRDEVERQVFSAERACNYYQGIGDYAFQNRLREELIEARLNLARYDETRTGRPQTTRAFLSQEVRHATEARNRSRGLRLSYRELREIDDRIVAANRALGDYDRNSTPPATRPTDYQNDTPSPYVSPQEYLSTDSLNGVQVRQYHSTGGSFTWNGSEYVANEGTTTPPPNRVSPRPSYLTFYSDANGDANTLAPVSPQVSQEVVDAYSDLWHIQAEVNRLTSTIIDNQTAFAIPPTYDWTTCSDAPREVPPSDLVITDIDRANSIVTVASPQIEAAAQQATMDSLVYGEGAVRSILRQNGTYDFQAVDLFRDAERMAQAAEQERAERGPYLQDPNEREDNE